MLFTLVSAISLIVPLWATLWMPNLAKAMPKKYDLVLIHGYSNHHQWSTAFLQTLSKIWGSGRVYVIYANASDRIWTEERDGRVITFVGENDHEAGTQSLEEQAAICERKIKLLHQKAHLSPHFDIIAHSMGGLVARELVYKLPHQVAGLVTLGAPHHGTPLANEFEWLGLFLRGKEGIADLRPERVALFNRHYPLYRSPFYDSGKMYTIGGRAFSWLDRGWHGELAVGWTLMSLKYGVTNDGVVKEGEATMDGAQPIADFVNCNHQELIHNPVVALKAAQYLR